MLVSFALPAILLGFSLATAWLLPGGGWCALTGWVAGVALALLSRTKRPYLGTYLGGLISHSFAFYWLFFTISQFGGFGYFPAALIFALFVIVSALQFPLAILFSRHLPGGTALALASGWTAAEFCSIRIFPWHLGHTQIGFPQFAQLAELGGSQLLTWLMVYVCAQLIERRWVTAVGALLLSIIYGQIRISQVDFSTKQAPKQTFVVVQGNVSLEEKHDPRTAAASGATYRRLSEEALSRLNPSITPIVVWPETAVVQSIPVWMKNLAQHPRFPAIHAAHIFGALGFENERVFYNSAFAANASGDLQTPYHKRILMPFGEYTPLADWFPWIKELNNTIADFTAGSRAQVFELGPARPAPLICYEDVAPLMAREAVQDGANVLVNMSNDAWFGTSPASNQHQMIASFRAIENRRFLIRATNTGTTSVLSPTGEVIAELARFEPQSLVAEVALLSYKTPYTLWVGEWPRWVLLILCVVCTVLRNHYAKRLFK